MNINEIKNRFPSTRFYKLREEPEKEFLKLDHIDDLTDLTSKIGYFEVRIESEEVSELNLKSVIQVYSQNLSFSDRIEFINYLDENKSKQLKDLCHSPGYTSIRLYGLDIDVMYDDEESGIDFVDVVLVEKELDLLYRIFCEKKENDLKTREQEVSNLIESYKTKYMLANSNKDREEVVKTVQLTLREKFGLDGRADPKYTKLSLKLYFENTT